MTDELANVGEVQLRGEDVVVRFSPFTAEGMEAKILKDFKVDLADGVVPARYLLSVFATSRLPNESIDDAADRLCAEMLESQGAPNGERISVVEGWRLIDGGFRGVLDEPPQSHYVVGQADFTEMPSTESLQAIFSKRRKNVSFKG